jgi:hypothetical protein
MKQNTDFHKDKSRERLSLNMKKKVKTTMIGALASIEEHLGFLWGHNQDNPTEDQDEIRDIFEDLRSEILDRGNHQIRNIDIELSQYDIIWNRYRYNIPTNNKD